MSESMEDIQNALKTMWDQFTLKPRVLYIAVPLRRKKRRHLPLKVQLAVNQDRKRRNVNGLVS